MIRIGHGYDVHTFKEGDFLIIGGVKIAYKKSFLAHSDGDVLIHSICDSILGALGEGDIGKHFPDTDSEFENIDSRLLLRSVIEKMLETGYRIGNIDATIVAQSPKMSPYIDKIRDNISYDCQTKNINIKATTTEKLGFEGREEGISSHCVCLLVKNN